jgi:undecaprenyl-diphosphatase
MIAHGASAWAAVIGAAHAVPSIGLDTTPGGVGAVASVGTDLLRTVFAVDAAVMELLVSIRHPLLTKVMTSVTGLGSATAAIVFLGIFYLAGWRRELAVGAVALAASGLVVPALMYLVQRPFPADPVCLTDGSGMTPHSFPSGHAAAVTVFALVSRSSENLPFRAVTALAATVAVSRIYLGTHFLSDTVAGILIGAVAFALGRTLAPRLRTIVSD